MFLGGRFGVLYRTLVLCMVVTKETNIVHPSMIYRTKEDWSDRGERGSSKVTKLHTGGSQSSTIQEGKHSL